MGSTTRLLWAAAAAGVLVGLGLLAGPLLGSAGRAGNAAGWLAAPSALLVAVGVGLLLAWAARRPSDGPTAGGDTPLGILQRRYARGEIGRDDYERVRGDLTADGGGA